LRSLETFGLDLHPKLVIFGIFAGNDVVGAENFESWLANGSPGNYDVWRFFEGRPPSRSRDLLGDSQLLLFLKSVQKTMGQAYSSETLEIPNRGKLQLVPAIHRRAQAMNQPQDPAFRKVIESAVSARNLTVANGGEFLVMLFPTKEEIYLPLAGVAYPSLTRPLRDALEEQDIRCIDLSERFHESAAQNEKLYFPIDGHPNKAGNRIIAGVVIEHLRNAQPLPDKDTGK
jgi:hypothetical protein